MQAGHLKLCGRSPSEVGIPHWRAQVMYVHQSRVNFKGTPNDFYKLAQSFCSQQDRPRGDLPALVHELGLDAGVLEQQWSELSVSKYGWYWQTTIAAAAAATAASVQQQWCRCYD